MHYFNTFFLFTTIFSSSLVFSGEKEIKEAAETIFTAAAQGKVSAVRELLNKGVSCENRDADHATPLEYAAFAGEVEVVELLLNSKAGVNVGNKKKQTPLMLAACSGSDLTVHCLLMHRANIDQEDEGASTALHFAGFKGSTSVAKLLWKAGAKIDAQNAQKMTPLMVASNLGHNETVNSLLIHRANINSKDKEGYTALSHALSKKQFAIAKTLLTQDGIDINVKCSDEEHPIWKASFHNKSDIVKLLVEKRADVNFKTSVAGQTPLCAAAVHGDTQLVEYLLSHKAEVNHQDSGGTTPLTFAAIHNKLNAARALLKGGALVDLADHKGATPLDIAIDNNNCALVMLFKFYGADSHKSLRNSGITPFLRALFYFPCRVDNEDMVRVLAIYNKDLPKIFPHPIIVQIDGSTPKKVHFSSTYQDSVSEKEAERLITLVEKIAQGKDDIEKEQKEMKAHGETLERKE